MLSKTKKLPSIKVRCVNAYDDYIPSFYRTFHCNSANVCETLKEEVAHWIPRNPTLIDAPTGSRKSTLAFECIIPLALEYGKHVLIISNRIALGIQQKRKIMEVIQSPLIDRLTDKGICETENFGSVCVITYHRLPSFVKDPDNQRWIRNLMYVVADEVHFFSADSAFNSKTGYYLKLLTQEFKHAARIYMTATSWDILYPLAEAEKTNYHDIHAYIGPWDTPREFRYYKFPSDYSHIDLHFFDDLKQIKERIQSVPEEKWLIFVESKTVGKALAKTPGERADYMDADSKGSEKWDQLLRNSHFKTQVLITTKVLDCGINIIDSTLRNIVIITDDRTSLVQMLGRKRCGPGERINLFVCDIDKKKLSERYTSCQELLLWYNRYTEASSEERKKMAGEIWHDSNSKLKHYFDLANGFLVPNRIAFFALKRKCQFYKTILSDGSSFQETVRSWLELPVESQVSPQVQLLQFCENHRGLQLSTEEIVVFRKLVIKAANQAGFTEPQPGRNDSLGREALNNRLRIFNCPYAISKKAWIIELVEEV